MLTEDRMNGCCGLRSMNRLRKGNAKLVMEVVYEAHNVVYRSPFSDIGSGMGGLGPDVLQVSSQG
jgi:hypothetical protein